MLRLQISTSHLFRNDTLEWLYVGVAKEMASLVTARGQSLCVKRARGIEMCQSVRIGQLLEL